MAETTTLKSRIKHAYKTEVEWSNSTVPLLEGEVAYSSDKGNMYKVGNGTSKWSELPYNKSDTANTATKLATARTIQTNLASDSTASFDGSANVTPGVTGVLPVANGGTGNSSVDTTPTSGSSKMVTSGGVYTALSEKQDTIPAWEGDGANSIVLNTLFNTVVADYSVAEGYGTNAFGNQSHAGGTNTTALGENSYIEGYSTNAVYNQIPDLSTNTSNDDIITAWNSNKFSLAKGNSSHVEGMDCLALGDYSHAEGRYTTASASGSHAEGYYTNASVYYSHAEGHYTTASAFGSHAEGYYTTASGEYSHAEGRYTTASASGSHAEGFDTTASGIDSHAEGYYTTASGRNQHVQGKYNIEDTSSTYAHIVGNGTADDARSNAYTLDWDGNGWYAGGLTVTSDLYLGDETIFSKIYPIGSIYMSVNNVNPGTLFGGTWVAWGSGRVPVGVNTSDTNFNTVEKTGGSATHTLTTSQIPSHTHSIPALSGSAASNGAHTHYLTYTKDVASGTAKNRVVPDGSGTKADAAGALSAGGHTHKVTTTASTTKSTGSGGAHNNLQPYITCYMWKRTA